MTNGSWSSKCIGCKVVGILTMAIAVIVAVVSAIALYRVLFILPNRIGTTDGSLAILATVFAWGMLKKAAKHCPMCGDKGCGCGAGCGCGGKDGCGCGHDHGGEPHQH